MYHETFAYADNTDPDNMRAVWHSVHIGNSDFGMPYSRLPNQHKHQIAMNSVFMPQLKHDLEPNEPLVYPGGEWIRTLHLPLKKDYYYGTAPARHDTLGIVLIDAPDSHYPMISEIKNANDREGPAQRMKLQPGILLTRIEGSSTYDIGHEKATEWLQARVNSLTKLGPDGKTYKHTTDYVIINIDAYKSHEYFRGGIHKAYEFFKTNQERDVAFAKAGLTPEPLCEYNSRESYDNHKWQLKDAVEQPVEFVLDEAGAKQTKPSFADVVKKGAQDTPLPVAVGKAVDSDGWFYYDGASQVHGPYDGATMGTWHGNGAFHPAQPVARSATGHFASIEELYPAGSATKEFLVDSRGSLGEAQQTLKLAVAAKGK